GQRVLGGHHLGGRLDTVLGDRVALAQPASEAGGRAPPGHPRQGALTRPRDQHARGVRPPGDAATQQARGGGGALVDAVANGVPAIEVSGLCKTYGEREALRGVDFTVARGEVFGLLGPNGAGKTTTVEVLEGYRERDGGEVRVLGRDPGEHSVELLARVGI